MVLFLQLASYLSSSLSALIHLVPSAIEASVSARRIMSVLELPREQLDHPERAQQLVREGVPLAAVAAGAGVFLSGPRARSEAAGSAGAAA